MSILNNTKKQAHLSIIIATLNVERTLDRCLTSIVRQTAFNKVEILIQDGGSIDNSTEIIRKYDRYISYWESSPDTGIYDAWNKLISKTKGEWLLFLGADDTLFDNSTISKSIEILENTDTGIEIAYGRVRLISSKNEKILDLGKDWEKTSKCIKEKMCMPHQGIFHKRSLFEQYGEFNSEYKICADYDFIKKALVKNNAAYLDMIISCMQLGGISSDPRNTFSRLKEMRHINKKHGQSFPGPLWLITYINACFRHSLYLIIGTRSTKYILDKLRALVGLPPFWTKF